MAQRIHEQIRPLAAIESTVSAAPGNYPSALERSHVDSQHQLSIDELLGKADRMMYERKRRNLAAAAT